MSYDEQQAKIDPTTPAGYVEFVKSRTKDMGGVTLDLHHATTGLCGEAGEALDVTKKMWVYNQSLMTKNKNGITHAEHLKEEAGDILFYLQMLCNHMGWRMQDLRDHNVAKLTKRYREGYSDAAAMERADKKETGEE